MESTVQTRRTARDSTGEAAWKCLSSLPQVTFVDVGIELGPGSSTGAEGQRRKMALSNNLKEPKHAVTVSKADGFRYGDCTKPWVGYSPFVLLFDPSRSNLSLSNREVVTDVV